MLHVQRNNVITHILTHVGPAAAKTCPYWLLASIFMDIIHTVRTILKLLNLNVLNFTVVLNLCESVVVSAWDCLVPGWLTVLIIFLFMLYLKELSWTRCWTVWGDVAGMVTLLCLYRFYHEKMNFACHRKQNSDVWHFIWQQLPILIFFFFSPAIHAECVLWTKLNCYIYLLL